jgi:GNAT superfamily N-acetyltransferase
VNIIEYSSDLYVGLYTLLRDTYDSKISKEDLENNYLCHDKMIFLTLIDNTVVGCAFLEIKRDYVRTYKYGYISYVAVDEKYRQHGIGRALIERLISTAKDMGCSTVELTSANSRKNAHVFYQNLGFSKKKTTVFIKEPL